MSKGMDIKKLNEFLAGGKPVDQATPVQDKCDSGKCCQDSAACEAGAAAPVEALTDMGEVSSKKSRKAKKYLNMVAAQDAGTVNLTQLALKGWKNPVNPSLPQVRQPKAKTPTGYPLQSEKTLEEHDKRWHKGNYTGGACQYRKDRGIETYEKKDAPGEKSDKLDDKTSVGTAELWDGELSKQGDDAIEAIGKKVFEDIGGSVYERMGYGGRIVMAQPFRDRERVRSVPANELSDELDDAVRETIVDELPELAEDYNRDELIKRVAQKMDSYVKNFVTWEDLEGKGDEYVDEA